MSTSKELQHNLKDDLLISSQELAPTISTSKADSTIAKPSWKSKIWDTWDHPDPLHLRSVRKVDIVLLSFACMSTFIKYIDKTNLTAAYVSGMQQDIGVKGDELNYANIGYNMTMIFCGYPYGYLMARFNTKWMIIFIEAGWILVTFCFSAIKTPTQMIVLRTLLGVFETGHYPALSFLLGSYYTAEELAKRNVVLQGSTAIGSMFASYIQSGAYTNLDGKLGRPGWSWTFIIDGVISLGVLIPQIVVFPDILGRLKPGLIFKEDEVEYLKSRKPEISEEKYTFTWRDLVKVFTTWEVWAFWLFGMSQSLASQSMDSFIFWIKGWNKIQKGSYTIPQINNFSSIMYAVQFVIAIGLGWWSDSILKGKRWPPLALAGIIVFIVTIILGSTEVYSLHLKGFRFFLYLNTCWALGSAGLYWAYAQEYFKDNIRLRAVVTGGINIYGSAAHSVTSAIWFRTSKQPYVQTGHYISAFFAILYALVAFGLGFKELKLSKSKEPRIIV